MPVSSTGIAGRNAYADSLVTMDAYAVAGLAKDRIRYLYGSSHLNPTYEYGVTFERGTAADYPDRRQVFISGTASIDNKGQIVYLRDISDHKVVRKIFEDRFPDMLRFSYGLRYAVRAGLWRWNVWL